MGKRGRSNKKLKPSHSQNRQTKKLAQALQVSTPPRKRFPWKRLGAVVATLSFVSSLFGYLIFWPSVSLEPAPFSLDPKRPLETRFFASNDGIFSIQDLWYQCEMSEIHSPKGDLIAVKQNMTRTFAIESLVPAKEPNLSGKLKYSIYCGDIFNTIISREDEELIDRAVLRIRLYFKPKFCPFSIGKTFRFLLKRDKDGNVNWLPTGSD